METAPLVQQQLAEVGRVLMLGSTGMLSTFLIFGVVAYVWLCLRSNRQWDALDHRWARPAPPARGGRR